MSGRSTVPQPGPPHDLEGFPQYPLPGGRWLYRLHAPWNGAWFFSSTPNGRFNLQEPRGTCYAADTVEAAVIETLGPKFREFGGVAATDASKYQVTPIRTGTDRALAHLEADDAWRWKVSRYLSACEDYEVPQEWAAAFDAAGFDGIRYLSNYTTGVKSYAYALFGPAGPDTTLPANLTNIVPGVVPGIAAFLRAGIPVINDDDLGDLTVVEPDWPDR